MLYTLSLKSPECDVFSDVAVGAPHEDDLKGAVYIYNGKQHGMSATPSQVSQTNQSICRGNCCGVLVVVTGQKASTYVLSVQSVWIMLIMHVDTCHMFQMLLETFINR